MDNKRMHYFILGVPDETVELISEDADKRLTTEDVIAEFINDAVDGLLGRSPDLRVELRDAELTQPQECVTCDQSVVAKTNIVTNGVRVTVLIVLGGLKR